MNLKNVEFKILNILAIFCRVIRNFWAILIIVLSVLQIVFFFFEDFLGSWIHRACITWRIFNVVDFSTVNPFIEKTRGFINTFLSRSNFWQHEYIQKDLIRFLHKKKKRQNKRETMFFTIDTWKQWTIIFGNIFYRTRCISFWRWT